MLRNKFFMLMFTGIMLGAFVLAGCEEEVLEGEGYGHNEDEPIAVEVTVDDEGDIQDVIVVSHDESEDVAEPAIEEIPQEIVQAGGTDVDVVSGATKTSEGIIEAVEDALN